MLPADLPSASIAQLSAEAATASRRYRLESQLRVLAGGDYVEYIRDAVSGVLEHPREFEGYDLRFYDDPSTMHAAIRQQNEKLGLSRMLAGFAWPHLSKRATDSHIDDITIGDFSIQWNRKMKDWVNSSDSINEAGSIYTIQGYDLNVAGVIIGPDLTYRDGKVLLDSANYFDPRGNQRNNNLRKITYTDADIQRFVENIYTVLLTRGIRGTYIHVVDPALREYLRPFFPPANV